MQHALEIRVRDGFGQLRGDTDPGSIEAAVANGPRPLRLQFDEPLAPAVLSATAATLKRHPEVTLRAYGREVDPSLAWLHGFEHIEHLRLELWNATSFAILADFTRLRSLSLGQTASTRPSLGFLRRLPTLSVLSVEAHARDFEAVGELASLRRLTLRAPRVKSLDALRGHAGLEVFAMSFGGVRNLTPLAEIPKLRGLQLYQVRKLDTHDLDGLAGCERLEAVSLGALRNVGSLHGLARGAREALRFLTLERLTGLATLEDLAQCVRLEQLGLYETRSADRRLDVLLGCQALDRLVVGDAYSKEQVQALETGFRGATLWLRGEHGWGALDDVAVRWRAPVHTMLGVEEAARTASRPGGSQPDDVRETPDRAQVREAPGRG